MATDDFNPADLDDVAASLKAIEGVNSADTDPSKVQTPGVWIRFDGLGAGTLAGLAVKVTLHAVVASTGDRRRDLGAVATLHNLIKPVVESLGGPSGVITPTGLILPGSATPLPCLQVPVDLMTTN